MQKLIKRRMRSYLHPTSMGVRGYLGESPGVTYTPSDSSKTNQAHVNAATQIAIDALKGGAVGAIAGSVGGTAGTIRGGIIGAVTKGTESIGTNCVNCHQKK